MTDISVNVTDKSVPINGLTDDPEITIRRNDTGAIVAGPSAMTDRTADGLYTFNFVETAGIDYSFLIDADPLATKQVSKAERYYSGFLDGTLTSILEDTGIMQPIVSTNLDATVSSRNSGEP